MSDEMTGRRIGLALGSGSARGWAHLGVLQALEERGIKVDVVTGASVGALVAAAYASGQRQRKSKYDVGPATRQAEGFLAASAEAMFAAAAGTGGGGGGGGGGGAAADPRLAEAFGVDGE